MQYTGLNELREKFLSFFEEKGHLRMPSFPLLPQGDHSLLLINSGMAPLKPYFSGEVTPPRKRVTTCQKCIRTPDIERVGKTSRHGTFFEMLGNFSFGDYFKREAMIWAWEFITKVLEIPEDKLYVSVYLDDDEAFELWTKEIGVREDHMVRLGKADNFWEIGAGPCGPCSEIYFDRGEQYSCGSPDCAVGCDCDRYVEFWNLVFTQYYNDGNDNYSPLKQKNIDTGMGLERLACIMQGVNSLFEVDTVKNIMKHISKLANVTYGDSEKTDISLRIITDHIRSTTMMVCDGVMPSNEGRGYVLRRLLRRAARHGRLLGINGAFLNEVCDTVIHESGNAYSELIDKKEFIKKVIRMEEEGFNRTIDSGLSILNDMIAKLMQSGNKVLSGEDVFKLNDTFGFPVDLTIEILEEQGLTLDRARFDELMDEQRKRGREAQAALGDFAWESIELGLSKEIKTEFTGYTELSSNAKILAMICNGELATAAGRDDSVSIVLDKSPFYAEMGGQLADTGTLKVMRGSDFDGIIQIADVKRLKDGKFLHIGLVIDGSVTLGDTVSANVDASRRQAIMRAHSTTHLLQKALRNILGAHVEQAGSLVGPDTIRFDFTHFSSLTNDELRAVELEVNEKLMEGMQITVTEMPIEEAKKLGAMALFGEKYGAVVRVIKMGDYSVEFCGGTHLDNTARAGLFKIVSEASIAAGVRRIEAVCGQEILQRIDESNKIMLDMSDVLKTSPKELISKAASTVTEIKSLKQEIERLHAKEAKSDAQALINNAKNIAGLKVITASYKDLKGDAMRGIGSELCELDENTVAVLASVTDGKIVFTANCGKAAITRGIKAGNLVREVAKIAGGSGGGKPDSAMAGGNDISKLEAALVSVNDLVTSSVN